MPTIRTGDGLELYYRDWGKGPPVVFVASWSLTSDSWAYQMLPLVRRGFRCIAYDRRGHGRSDDPGGGYDYDTLADDLAALLDTLDLTGVTLVGHSMGPGEIVRYLSRHGIRRTGRIAMIGTITPMIQQAEDNPHGVPPSVFQAFRDEQLIRDFPAWIEDNAGPFVTPETTPHMIDWVRGMCLQASLQALYECNVAITTADFRAELRQIELPTLLLHGDLDITSPLALTAQPTAALMPNARIELYEGAPHGLFLTHAERVNADLVRFMQSAPT
ncbi:MAG TPA: alpha/beta hydrolase [Geminicoccus sp.]|jgi:pimeloyl-ACP methyl ester carboxylesterase|uniref:alpha/beta fold hydrolase n=1 Tax=Geminicoccus sp. TaxID=2024832 RepID=UPI002E341658|nr:alpha/beta hydrolase [Geminicoccus sp.]HEX2528419.1 alpha/beta hydrolase [Geminicoccus sp.]